LDDADRIMLIDFGIAKEAVASEQTRAMGRAVTHGYSPPEQAMGTGTDARSDVYALGATVLFMLTGQRPPGAAERIQGATIPEPSKLVPGIPPAIDRAILQALALNPNERQQDVKEFGKAFDYDSPTIKTYGDVPDRTVMAGEAVMSGVDSTSTSMPSIKLTPDGAKVFKPEPGPTTKPSPGASIGKIAAIASVAGLLIAGAVVAYIGSNFGGSTKKDTELVAPSPTPPTPAVDTPEPNPASVTNAAPSPVVAPTPPPVENTVLNTPPAPAPSPAPTPSPIVAPSPVTTEPSVVTSTPTNNVVPPPAPAPSPVVAPAPAPAPTPSTETVNNLPPPPSPEPANTTATEAVTPPSPSEQTAEPEVVAKKEPVKKQPAKKKKKVAPVDASPEPEPETEMEPAADTGNAANAWQKANEGATFIEGN
ncbi:MAG: hypothetical protein U1F34_09975, partial [Gammaproteobacteria bacterium]